MKGKGSLELALEEKKIEICPFFGNSGADPYDGFQTHSWACWIENHLRIMKMQSRKLES